MRRAVRTDQGPRPVGPYSQGIVASGQFVYVSGQGPINPATQKLELGSIEEETRRTLDNIRGILEAAGATMRDVVKCNVYLRDMADFAAMNEVYKSYFGEEHPARTTVGTALGMGIKVEIDAIAVLPEASGA